MVFGFQDKIILSCEINLVIGGLAMTNYPMIIHLRLSCGVESHEPNRLQI